MSLYQGTLESVDKAHDVMKRSVSIDSEWIPRHWKVASFDMSKRRVVVSLPKKRIP